VRRAPLGYTAVVHPLPARRPSRLALAALALLALSAAIAPAVAGGRAYRFDAYRIQAFALPRGYVAAPQLPWPGLLLLAVGSPAAVAGAPPAAGGGPATTDSARLVLAAQRVIVGQDAVALCADARAALLRQGFGDPRMSERSPGPGGELRSQLDATLDRGRQSMRQVYIVSGDVAVVLTVTAPTAAFARALREFEAALESLELSPPAPAAAPPTGPAADPPAPPTPGDRPPAAAPPDGG
jgi:hypothetical protein